MDSHRSPAATWLHAGFVLAGMITVQLGPILPSLSARLHIDNSHAGLFFTAQFASSVAGVLLSSVLLTRSGFRACLATGFLAAGAGVGTLGFGSWTTAMFSVGAYGLGLGLIIPGTNLLVAEMNPQRAAAALNWLNMAWGAGAVIFPSLAAGFLKAGRLDFLLLALAGMAMVFAVWAAVFAPASLVPQGGGERGVSKLRALSFAEARALGILGALFFLYVGTENGVAGWVASYARSVGAGTPAEWALAPAFFWGALLLGRALAPAVLRRVAEIRLARMGLAAAALGGVVVIASREFAGLSFGAALAGFGLSSVFPITIARFSCRLGQQTARFAGTVFALGGFGGAILPWLIGLASVHFGSLREALTIPVAASLLMIALYGSRSLEGRALVDTGTT